MLPGIHTHLFVLFGNFIGRILEEKIPIQIRSDTLCLLLILQNGKTEQNKNKINTLDTVQKLSFFPSLCMVQEPLTWNFL